MREGEKLGVRVGVGGREVFSSAQDNNAARYTSPPMAAGARTRKMKTTDERICQEGEEARVHIRRLIDNVFGRCSDPRPTICLIGLVFKSLIISL